MQNNRNGKTFVKKVWKKLKRIRNKNNQVLFFTVRADGKLLDNMQAVYDSCKGKKVIFAKMYPHSKEEKAQAKKLIKESKVIVTDDYLSYLRRIDLKKEQKVIQIWHACGAFKKFGLDVAGCDVEKELKSHKQYDAVIVSSEEVRKVYAEAFGIPEGRVLALGTPRTDRLLSEKNKRETRKRFYEKYPEYQKKKIIVYAPTFRETGGERIELEPQLDWNKVSTFLGQDKVLLIRNHPVMKYDLLKGAEFQNIKNVPEENTNDLMLVADVVVTDYSSVMFEAALLNKSMVFYCPDLENYDRDFYLKFPEDVYGEFATNQEEFLKSLTKALECDKIKGLDTFKKRYLGSCDGHSAKRVARLIAKYRKD